MSLIDHPIVVILEIGMDAPTDNGLIVDGEDGCLPDWFHFVPMPTSRPQPSAFAGLSPEGDRTARWSFAGAQYIVTHFTMSISIQEIEAQPAASLP
jgi:hypothetical protein